MKHVLLFVCVFFMTPFGKALKCYECRGFGGSNIGCYDPINNETIQQHDCRNSHQIPGNHRPDTTYQCVAYLIHHKITNITTVNRQCAIKSEFDQCGHLRKQCTFDGCIVDSCYTCETDLCNSSERLQFCWFALPMLFLYKIVFS